MFLGDFKIEKKSPSVLSETALLYRAICQNRTNSLGDFCALRPIDPRAHKSPTESVRFWQIALQAVLFPPQKKMIARNCSLAM